MNVEIKSVQSGSTKFGFEVYRKTVDRGHQIGAEMMVDRGTQSPWRRKINRIVEYAVNDGDGATDSKTASLDEDEPMRSDHGAHSIAIGVGFEEHAIGDDTAATNDGVADADMAGVGDGDGADDHCQ